MIVIRVQGANRLVRTMKQAGVSVTDLKDANRGAADIVARAARPLTPVGPDKGGHVRNSIRTGATNRAGIVRAGGARYPYAGVLHYGNPHTVQGAQPWVADAAQRTEGTWTAHYLAKLDHILDQIKGE